MELRLPWLPFDLNPLIAEAKRRARRRRLWIAVLALAVAGASTGIALTSGGGGSSGAIPWLPTRPQLGPAKPPLAPACSAAQLQATLSVQAAAGNFAAPISIVNRSSQPCALVGRPRLSFAGAPRWHVAPMQGGGAIFFDPLAPPLGSLRALPPGEHVFVQLMIPLCAGPLRWTKGPHALVFTAPGGGRLRLDNRNTELSARFAECGPSMPAAVQATRFLPYVPQGPPSSALPLRARIVSPGPIAIKDKTLFGASLVAHLGSWLSYTVVLTNTSHAKPFRFGRRCPAYTERIAGQTQAYVLNCHAVRSIGPGRSVRFAMRVRVPAHSSESPPSLVWTLAPHTYGAPQTGAVVQFQ